MHTKLKGDIGELLAAESLLRQGWHVSFPFGDRLKYDLVAEKQGIFKRVQVKAVFPRNGVLHVNCRSSNNWSSTSYSERTIDVIAAVDLDTKDVYYIPAEKIGKNLFDLRLVPAKNNQKARVNDANQFTSMQ